MGWKGGRVFRNMYKGPMDKAKGGKWWWENGDNCIRTTIKNDKNNKNN